ncbi:MAG: CvpA family protein [Clostridiales bacterium]|nr:CvpA family protein [Clostridiales bacterium]
MEKKSSGGKIKRVLINLLITLLIGLVYFYFKLPAINLQDRAFYSFFLLLAGVYCFLSIATQGLLKAETGGELWSDIKKHCAIPVIVCAVLVVIYIIGSLISSPIIRAASYRELLTVVSGDFASEVTEITYDQIPMLDEDSAMKLGDKKMGELADMVSQFEVADDYTQINYKERPVRVTPLKYGDIFKWIANRSEGLPAYIIIDMVTQEADAVRLENGMKYTTTEFFFRNVSRHLRFNYPTFIFDKANFEIDDEGTPYWICPRIVKRIGLFGGQDIQGAVLMNAISGECEYYENIPSWVDRVYDASIIIQQYDYYGMYRNGWINSFIGQKNVTVTTDGYNYIAIDGDVYMYTGITSVVNDNSIVGFILANQRTKETKYYSCAGAIEYAAMSSAEGIVQYMEYKATFPLLLNISNQPTYFMALKDSGGLVKMYAMVNVQQYQLVASGTTLAQCEENYIELLAQSNLAIPESLSDKTAQGKITDIKTAVIDGNTHVFIKLDSDNFYYIISVEDSKTAAILSEGQRVKIFGSSSEGDLRSAYSVEILR